MVQATCEKFFEWLSAFVLVPDLHLCGRVDRSYSNIVEGIIGRDRRELLHKREEKIIDE